MNDILNTESYHFSEQQSFINAMTDVMRLIVRGFTAWAVRSINDFDSQPASIYYSIVPNQDGQVTFNSKIKKCISHLQGNKESTLIFSDLIADNVNVGAGVRLFASEGDCEPNETGVFYILKGCYFHGESESIINKSGGNDIIRTKIDPDSWLNGIYDWYVINNKSSAKLSCGKLFVWTGKENKKRHGLAVTINEDDLKFAHKHYMEKSDSL